MNVLNYVAGEHVPAVSDAWLDKVAPASGEVIARVADSDARDVENAVAAAVRAFPAWARTPAAERSRLMMELAGRIDERHEELARAETMDTGKPIRLSRAVDIPRASANLRFFATAVLHF